MAIPSIDTTPNNYNVASPDIIGGMAKMASLRQMQGQNAMLPGALQAQQLENQQRQQALQMGPEQLKAAQLENQTRQMEITSQQNLIKAISDKDFSDKIFGSDGASSSGLGFDPSAGYTHLVQNGVLPKDAQSLIAGWTDISKNAATMTKDQISNFEKGHDALAQKIAPIVDMPISKAGAALDALKQDLARNPIPGVGQQDMMHLQQATLDQLPALINTLGVAAKIADYHKSQAETEKAGLEVAAPTSDQLSTFTKKTIPSFSALRPEQKSAYIAEAQQARTVPELNAVVARADATDKAEQMHADSLAQTKAMVGNKFGEAGLTANEKIWTDPQHGFAGALAQAKQTKNSIIAGADGNGLLTSMVPTMEVLGINHAAGISRISPQEAEAAQLPGGWAERWNAWATKSATGKLTPQLAKEGQQLMDVVLESAHQKALTSSQLIAAGHGLTPAQTPAMDKNGNVTTLDKVLSGGGGVIFARDPNGILHQAPAGTPLPQGWKVEKQQ